MLNDYKKNKFNSNCINIIKINRYKLKLSQLQLAKKCEVTQSLISKFENNRKLPSATMIIKLGNILKINPVTIFEEFYCTNYNFLEISNLPNNENKIYS